MSRFHITVPIKRDFDEYRVVIRPERVSDTLTIYKRRPGARFFKYKYCVQYLMCIMAEQARLAGVDLDAPDAIVEIAKLSIRFYEQTYRLEANEQKLAAKQRAVFDGSKARGD